MSSPDQVNGAAPLTPAQQQVVKKLEHFLARAKRGDINYIGIVAVRDPQSAGSDHAGLHGCEFAANFGVDFLKQQIAQSFLENMQKATIVTQKPTIVRPG